MHNSLTILPSNDTVILNHSGDVMGDIVKHRINPTLRKLLSNRTLIRQF